MLGFRVWQQHMSRQQRQGEEEDDEVDSLLVAGRGLARRLMAMYPIH